MDEVANRAADGTEGLTVVAAEQTEGRGRANRRWHAAPGSSLLFSTLLRPNCGPERFQVFPLLAGLAVAESIEKRLGIRTEVKWPNDVLIDGRKVAGLLVTSRVEDGRIETAILGVGVNVFQVPAALGANAIALGEATGRSPDLELLLNEILASLSAAYEVVLSGDTRESLDRWLERAVYLRDQVEILDGETSLSGRFSGITEMGALVLQVGDEEFREVHAGDMVRGPVKLHEHRA